MTSRFKPVNVYARAASIYHFALEGSLMGIWACYLPSIQDKLDIDDSSLGIAVLLMYFGTVVATQLAAVLTRRFGSRNSTFLGAIGFSVCLPFIALAPGFEVLCLVMFLYGYFMGVMDVSMNGIAVLTEMVAEKPLLNSIHGCYSLAAGVMTVMAGLLSSAGWTALPVYSVAAAVTVLCSCVAYQGAYSHEDELDITRCHNDVHHGVDEVAVVKSEQTEEHPTSEEGSGDAGGGGTLLNAVFLNFAGIGFLASFGEVSMTAWSVIYFQRCLGTSTLKASVGFGTFMVATAIGRFGGDKMREFWGRRRLIRRCGMCLVLGFAVLLYSPSVADKETTGLIVGYFGSMLIGFGLSVLIPIVFSSAGHLPGVHAGSAIAAAAACTYTGSIVSPFFLGLCSQLLHSLREAYMIDAGLMCGVFVLSFMIPDESSKWFGATGDETEKLLVGEEEQ